MIRAQRYKGKGNDTPIAWNQLVWDLSTVSRGTVVYFISDPVLVVDLRAVELFHVEHLAGSNRRPESACGLFLCLSH